MERYNYFVVVDSPMLCPMILKIKFGYLYCCGNIMVEIMALGVICKMGIRIERF